MEKLFFPFSMANFPFRSGWPRFLGPSSFFCSFFHTRSRPSYLAGASAQQFYLLRALMGWELSQATAPDQPWPNLHGHGPLGLAFFIPLKKLFFSLVEFSFIFFIHRGPHLLQISHIVPCKLKSYLVQK